MASTIISDIREKIRNGNPVTRLIIINVIVFLFISLVRIIAFFSAESGPMVTFESFLIRNLEIPLNADAFIHKPWTLFTHFFTHIKIAHLFWNMITLYWFGSILSEYTSERKIIPLYLLGALSGAIIAILLVSYVPLFDFLDGNTAIGASAGVTAIVVAAATLLPNYRMGLLFIGEVKLIYVAIFVIFIDVLNMASYDNSGGNLGHLGGALMGYLYIVQYKKGKDMANPINRFFGWIGGLFGKSSRGRMKVVHKRGVSDEEYNYMQNVNQKQVDAILDKISKSGYESLSKTEKDILFKASNKK